MIFAGDLLPIQSDRVLQSGACLRRALPGSVLPNTAFVTKEECQRHMGIYLTFRAMEGIKGVSMRQQNLQQFPHLSVVWVIEGTIEGGPAYKYYNHFLI